MRVVGSSINHLDLMLRQGHMRLLPGARGLGLDFAGKVEEVGPGVTVISAGVRVWGYTGYVPGPTGTAAEYVLVKATRLSVAPQSIDLNLAAALPVAGLTALQALRVLGVRAGERLLVTGGAGDVGSAAIQLGVSAGADVTASCSSATADFCRSAGAGAVIRYDADDLGIIAASFDAILDTVGADLAAYRRLAARGGRFATVAPRGVVRIPLWLVTAGPRMRLVVGKPSGADLAILAAEVDSGRVRPLVQQSYPLAAIAEAHRDAEQKPGMGKRVLLVNAD